MRNDSGVPSVGSRPKKAAAAAASAAAAAEEASALQRLSDQCAAEQAEALRSLRLTLEERYEASSLAAQTALEAAKAEAHRVTVCYK